MTAPVTHEPLSTHGEDQQVASHEHEVVVLDDDRPAEGRAEAWRSAPLVALLRRLPREQRERAMVRLFAVASVTWAPVGVVAVVLGRTGPFLLVSAVLGAVLFAPRPADLAEAVDAVRSRAVPVVRTALERGGVLLGRLARAVEPVVRSVAQRSGPVLRTVGERVAAALRSGARWLGALSVSVRDRISDALRPSDAVTSD